MKKLLIAGAGLSTLAIAALPAAGVFAASVSSVEDTVKLTIDSNCQMSADSATNTIDLGSSGGGAYSEKAGSTMTITCNTPTGWNIKASATALTVSGNNALTIPFGAYSTSSSVWSAKIALGGNNTTNATVADNWSDYSATGTATGGTIVVSNVANTAVSGLTVTPSYKAYAASDQPAGTYQGTITYTFTGASS